MGMQLKCSMYYVKSFIVLLETGILKDELVSLIFILDPCMRSQFLKW